MKPSLSSILILAAVAAMFSSAAQASQSVFVPLVAGSGLTQTGAFSDAAVTPTGPFTDDYVFASQPGFSTASFASGTVAGVAFSSVTLKLFGTTTFVPLGGSLTATSFALAPSVALGSATYVLEITGTAAAGGGYTGTITDTGTAALVPEPGAWALMLVGLGAGGLRLRRRREAAPV